MPKGVVFAVDRVLADMVRFQDLSPTSLGPVRLPLSFLLLVIPSAGEEHPEVGPGWNKGSIPTPELNKVARRAESLRANPPIRPLTCTFWRDEGMLMHYPSCKR